ncbi:unnamed protein product, partial [Nesidiocoris tenuis]
MWYLRIGRENRRETTGCGYCRHYQAKPQELQLPRVQDAGNAVKSLEVQAVRENKKSEPIRSSSALTGNESQSSHHAEGDPFHSIIGKVEKAKGNWKTRTLE